jgi:hypothetical protein
MILTSWVQITLWDVGSGPLNWGSVSQQMWHVKEPSSLKSLCSKHKHKSKFAAQSPIMVIAAKLHRQLFINKQANNGDKKDFSIGTKLFNLVTLTVLLDYFDLGHNFWMAFIFHMNIPSCWDPGENRSSMSPYVLWEETELGSPSDETKKTEASCHSRSGMIKIPPCSKALSAKLKPKFCSLSLAMVMSP